MKDKINKDAIANIYRKTSIDNAVPSLQRMKIDRTLDSEYKKKYNKTKIEYSFNEKNVLKELNDYIDETYSNNYTNNNNNIQGLDVWKARGTMTDSCIDTTIKYLMRYGKGGDYNRKDLLKAAHYIILALGNKDN